VAYRAALLNFSKGEISPELESRFDLPAYQAAARRARNVKIRRTGGLSKRMGTRFVIEAKDADARLVPFQFSDEQAYALEMGQGFMRPLALGGAVVEDGLKTTAITKAVNAQVTCAFHGYAVGELVYFEGIEGMIEINNRFGTVVTVPDANTFTVDIDSTNFSTFVSDTGTVNAGPPPPPPADPVVPPPLDPPPTPGVGSGSTGGYQQNPVSGEREWISYSSHEYSKL